MANHTRACVFYVIMTVDIGVSQLVKFFFFFFEPGIRSAQETSSVRLKKAEHNEPCCVGTVKEGELQGVSKQIGDLETYVVGPSTAGTPAVLLLPDTFGFGIPNNK